jgi:3-deoxy-manno-octulosonate cytidylyltransferase (CMP-KDO synthetase)
LRKKSIKISLLLVSELRRIGHLRITKKDRRIYMKALIVIPARYASTRLPAKPLLDKTGWPLIRHTYEQAKKAELAERVVVATDDPQIKAAVQAFGGEAVMTRPDHPSGTDRIAEVVEKIDENFDIIVNVQGDEPEIEPEVINRIILLHQVSNADVSTIACPFPVDKKEGNGSPHDPACVKAVLGHPIDGIDNAYKALYFSRSVCPFPRQSRGIVEDPTQYYLHLGMYAYSPVSLKRFVMLDQGALEKTESLEQLRVLENGMTIAVGVIEKATPGIDTPEDYTCFVERWREKNDV